MDLTGEIPGRPVWIWQFVLVLVLLHEELEVGGEGGGVQARATHHPRRQAAQGRVTHRVRDLNKESVITYCQDLCDLHQKTMDPPTIYQQQSNIMEDQNCWPQFSWNSAGPRDSAYFGWEQEFDE